MGSKWVLSASIWICASAFAAGGHHHGEGQLEIALDGNRLDVNLVAPGADLAGVSTAGNSLLTIDQGGCTGFDVTASEVEVDHGHSDITLTQSFECTRPAAIGGIRVSLFDWAPSLEAVEVVYLSDDTTVATELTPATPVLALDD